MNSATGQRMADLDSIGAFWKWFAQRAALMAVDPTAESILAEVDAQVRHLHKGLSWEIGPGSTAEWAFTLSPDLEPALMQIATDAVERAPVLEKWEFHSRRRPKQWERRFEVRGIGGKFCVDVSDWTFVLLQYVDGGTGVLVCPSGPIGHDVEQRGYALRVLMESELGETVLLDDDVEFELLDDVEEALRGRLRPIRELRAAFGLGD